MCIGGGGLQGFVIMLYFPPGVLCKPPFRFAPSLLVRRDYWPRVVWIPDQVRDDKKLYFSGF